MSKLIDFLLMVCVVLLVHFSYEELNCGEHIFADATLWDLFTSLVATSVGVIAGIGLGLIAIVIIMFIGILLLCGIGALVSKTMDK